MAYTITLVNDSTNQPRFIKFEDTAKKKSLLLRQPVFRAKYPGPGLDVGCVEVFDNGLHEILFLDDVTEVDGDAPGSVVHLFQLLSSISTLLV